MEPFHSQMDPRMSNAETSSPQPVVRSFGDLSGILAAQPAVGALCEEASTAIRAAQDTATTAASYLRPPGTAAMVSLEDRVTSLERFLSNLDGTPVLLTTYSNH